MTESIGQIFSPDKTALCRMWLVNLSSFDRPFLPHRHREAEISLVIKGHGTYKLQDREYAMEPGSGFLFCSQEIHCITSVTDGFTLLNLQFLPELLENRLTDCNGRDYRGMLYTHPADFSNQFDSGYFSKILGEIRDSFTNGDGDLVIVCKICELLARVIKERNLREVSEDYAQKVIACINANFRLPVSVEMLAKTVGITPNYLSKVFKDSCGMTVMDYLSLTRINFAKKRLTGSSENILDIALNCGYNNTANFNKAFKKYTAMTPRQYRSLARQKINVDI